MRFSYRKEDTEQLVAYYVNNKVLHRPSAVSVVLQHAWGDQYMHWIELYGPLSRAEKEKVEDAYLGPVARRSVKVTRPLKRLVNALTRKTNG